MDWNQNWRVCLFNFLMPSSILISCFMNIVTDSRSPFQINFKMEGRKVMEADKHHTGGLLNRTQRLICVLEMVCHPPDGHLPFCPPNETPILFEAARCPAKITAFCGGLSFICDTVLVHEI